jgi:pyridoxal phosphate enzyme (YggS family)
VKLLVASKAQTVERITELHALGQKFFAENYAQELFEKAPQLPPSIEWSYIGHLQSNKIKRIMHHACEIQTLSSLKHAESITRYAEELGKTPYKVFIEVQVPGDTGKSGVEMSQLEKFVQELRNKFSKHLDVQGLMAIPPLRYAEHWNEEAERIYKNLRTLASTVGAGKLSLGMSQDLEHSIECGSDIVRIGTAIMGKRY